MSANKLPKGWVRTTIGEVAQPTRPKITPSPSSLLPFIGMEHVKPRSLSIDGTARFSDMKSAAVHFLPGDVLYGRLRPYLNKVTEPDFEGACSSEFIVLPPTVAVIGTFLKYLLHHSRFVSFAAHQVSGDRPRIDFNQIAGFEFELPPLAEQERIVAAIDALFTRLDAAELGLKKAQILLKQYRASALHAAVSGELTREWRAQLGDAHGASNAPRRDKSVPDGWQVRSFDAVISGLRNGLSRKPEEQPPGERILRISAVRPLSVNQGDARFYRPERDERLAPFRVETGDLLFTRYNGSRHLVGVCGMYREKEPILHPDKLIRARIADTTKINPAYIEIAMNAGISRRYIESCIKTTAGQHGISGSDLKLTPIPLPTKSEQDEIVWRCIVNLDAIDQMEAEVAARLISLSVTRQSILAAAFLGEIVSQDPRDEPAEMLLKRIRSRRAAETPSPKRGRRKSKELVA